MCAVDFLYYNKQGAKAVIFMVVDFPRNKHLKEKEKIERKYWSRKGAAKTLHVVLEVCSLGKT